MTINYVDICYDKLCSRLNLHLTLKTKAVTTSYNVLELSDNPISLSKRETDDVRSDCMSSFRGIQVCVSESEQVSSKTVYMYVNPL